MVWRAVRRLKHCDRPSRFWSVAQLGIGRNETINNCHYGYRLKSRLMVWRLVRCLKSCIRLLSALLVMRQLRLQRSETSDSCHCIYLLKRSWSSVNPIIPFRLSLISFISFVVIFLCFRFNNFNFSLIYLPISYKYSNNLHRLFHRSHSL